MAWQDVAAPGAIVLALTPLYVLNVHDWPIQVGSDEIAIMTVAERWAEQGNPDLFGLSDYLGHPVLLFVVWGKLGELFGGIDLGTMRRAARGGRAPGGRGVATPSSASSSRGAGLSSRRWSSASATRCS